MNVFRGCFPKNSSESVPNWKEEKDESWWDKK